MFASKYDVFRGDVVVVEGVEYIVLDKICNNNGWFEAVRKEHPRRARLNTLQIERVAKRTHAYTYV